MDGVTINRSAGQKVSLLDRPQPSKNLRASLGCARFFLCDFIAFLGFPFLVFHCGIIIG